MFIATLFTIARTWKLPKCPSAEEWIKKMLCMCVYIYIYIYIYIYNGYYSAIKRNEIISFAVTWMDLEIVILSEVSKDRERQISYDIT